MRAARPAAGACEDLRYGRPRLLITGASSGIGAATARLAASRGWRVALATRSHDALGLAAGLGGPEAALPITCDISDWDEVASLASQVMQTFGRLDAVFANAGYFVPTSSLHGVGTPEQWRQMVLTNVYGTALIAWATLPILAQSRGHLLLTGSVAGRVMVPGQLYSATNWAVTAMVQSIRAEATTTGIRVTLIQPGLDEAGPTSPERAAGPKLSPGDVARAVSCALSQPPGVDVREVVIRPTGQQPWR